MKNNKRMLVGILLIIVLGLLAYLLYTKVLKNYNISDNLVTKIDEEYDWVYNANYNLITEKDSYYANSDHSKLIEAKSLKVPYINIDTEAAKTANEEIYKLYEDVIKKYNENLQEEVNYTLISYKVNQNANVISILITTESGGTSSTNYRYYTYNFDIKNGNLLTFAEIVEKTDKVYDEVITQAKDTLKYTMNDTYPDIDLSKACNNNSDCYKKAEELFEKSIEDGTILFYIEKNTLNLYIIAYCDTIPNGEENYQLLRLYY